MRIFAGDKVRSMMEWLGMEKGVAIESRTVSKQIERAQKAVEARNFETRKHVLKYDDVMNKQRETIYGLRRQLMFEPEHRDYLLGENGVARDLLQDLTGSFLSLEAGPDNGRSRLTRLRSRVFTQLTRQGRRCHYRIMKPDQIAEAIWKKASANYAAKEKIAGGESLRAYERYIMLNIIDSQWKDHLASIDQVKQGIGLVGYGQKDPLVEYKKQSFDMFQDMLDRIDTNTESYIPLRLSQGEEEERTAPTPCQQRSENKQRRRYRAMATASPPVPRCKAHTICSKYTTMTPNDACSAVRKEVQNHGGLSSTLK